jgi:hypothetical protein
MATYISPSISMQTSGATYNQAVWRAWAREMMTAMEGVGLIQTSDTGQLVPETAVPGSTSTLTGSQIWRFNDAEQSTYPIFLKIGYGRSGYASGPRLYLQVGTGSDGAGNLTGTVSNFDAAFSSEQNVNSSNFMGQHYAYFNNGCFWIGDVFFTTNTTHYNSARNFWFIARSRGTDHAFDGRGAITWRGSTNQSDGASAWMQFTRFASPAKVYSISRHSCFTPGSQTLMTYANGDLISWPFWYYDNGIKQCEMLWATSAASLSSTSPTVITASPYGVSRNWLSYNRTPRAGFRVGYATAEGYADSTSDLNSYRVVLPWDAS